MSSMVIKNAYTGEVSTLNPDTFLSIKELHVWIQDKMHIDPSFQLLLLAQNSAQLKLETIADGQEVFLYDKSLISDPETRIREVKASVAELVEFSLPKYQTTVPEDSMSQLVSKFEQRASWAKKAYELVQNDDFTGETLNVRSKLAVMRQGIEVALTHLANHSASLQRSFNSKVDFAVDLEQDLAASDGWERMLDKLKQISISPPRRVAGKHFTGKYLSDLVDESKVRSAYQACLDQRTVLQQTISTVESKLQDLVARGNQLQQRALARISAAGGSKNGDLDKEAIQDDLSELKTLYEKIARDYDYVSSLSDTGANRNSALRIAGLHEREFLPQMDQLVSEMYERYKVSRKLQSQYQIEIIQVLCELSKIQYQAYLLRPEIQEVTKLLHDTEEHRVQVAGVIDMPFLYGAVLIEDLRRARWAKSLKSQANSTVQRYAEARHAEIERCKAWVRHYGSTPLLGQLSASTIEQSIPEVDVRVRGGDEDGEDDDNGEESDGDDGEIREKRAIGKYIDKLAELNLNVERDDLQREYEESLRVNYHDESVDGSSTVPSDGNNDHRAFKGGSISDSKESFRRESDQQIKGFQAQIRKLEGLLHRHQVKETLQSGTPKSEASGGRLLEKIHDYKEINEQKDIKIAELERTIEELRTQQKTRDDEFSAIESVKKDLLANLASKEQELLAERKLSNDQQAELRARIEDLELEVERLDVRAMASNVRLRDISQKMYTSYVRSCELLESMGLQAHKEVDPSTGRVVSFQVNRVKGLGRRKSEGLEYSELDDHSPVSGGDKDLPKALYWMDEGSKEEGNKEDDRYQEFLSTVFIDYDLLRDSVGRRFGDVERLARKLQREVRHSRECIERLEDDNRSRIALRGFKPGDLVLFLPTRDHDESGEQTSSPWAAFNVGAPHCFLRAKSEHALANREYLVARVTGIEEHMVDKRVEADEVLDNPFGLGDGTRWYLIDAESDW